MMDISQGMGLAGAAAFCAGTAGLGAWGAVAPSSQLFGPTIRGTGNLGTIALTFDDGPNPEMTPKLLDLLERHCAKATFFVIGKFARQEPALTREIAKRGHSLGNHTETHPSLVFLSPSKIRDELSRCDEAIMRAAGEVPRWIRPPYGFRSPLLRGIARERNYSGVVMWSRMARDWSPQPAEGVITRLQRAKGGDIVLLHDGDHATLHGDREHMVKAVEHWLPRWRDAELRFVTLDEFGQDEAKDEIRAAAR